MLINCVFVGDEVINIGDWDYDVFDGIIRNPLPQDSYVKEAEVEKTTDGGYSLKNHEPIKNTDDIINDIKNELSKLSLSADDIYKRLDISVLSCEELKEYKIAQLDYLCNKTILGGFDSASLGESHHYDLDYEGQINMSGIMNAINAGLISSDIQWKTEIGNLPHTIDQMKQVYMDGLLFKQTQIEIYWYLKGQVQMATTKEEVHSINWN